MISRYMACQKGLTGAIRVGASLRMMDFGEAAGSRGEASAYIYIDNTMNGELLGERLVKG